MTINADLKVSGDKLFITVDLSKNFGASGSGKSIIVATTQGNVSVPGHDDIKIGLNVYRPAGSVSSRSRA